MPKQYETRELDGTNGKIYLGIPRERMIIPSFSDNRDMILYELEKAGRLGGFLNVDGHRVDRNRDRIVHGFLESPHNPEWLMFVDSDMSHPPTMPLRLTAWNKPIVGGLYFHRGHTHDPFIFNRIPKLENKDRYGRYKQQWIPLRDEVYDFLKENNVPLRDGWFTISDCPSTPLWEVDAVATGCMVIHRSVFETMEPPWFEYKSYGNSEDLTFCDDAKYKYGIPVHADVSTISGHLNWVAMGQTQFRALHESRGVELSGFTKNDAANWVAFSLGISPDDAMKRIEEGSAHVVGDYFAERFRGKKVEDIDPAEIRAFYESEEVGQLYIIELLHWNLSATFENMRRILIPVRGASVLELGSGIGSVAIQLALQQNNVVAVEVNEELREFTRNRWNDLNTYLRSSKHGELYLLDGSWRDKAVDDQFGIVVAFDVFEHLPKDDLQSLLREVHRVLPLGGKLVYHANFKQQNLYPMHYDHSDWWADFMANLGFMQVSPLEAMKIG